MRETIYVGIDWHKRTSAWVALDKEKRILWEHKKVPCTLEGIRTAHSLLVGNQSIAVSAAIEPVCGWRWATDLLEELGVDIHIINPLKMRSIADSSTKTDRTDALIMADMLRANMLPEAYKCSDDIQSMRDLVRVRAYLVRMSTGLKCRVHALCTQRGLHNVTAKPLSKESRQFLYEQGDPVIIAMMKALEDTKALIKEIEKHMDKVLAVNNEIQLIMSIPGIGKITALSIYAEVGKFERFARPEALVNYAGLHPRERSSGGRQSFGRITKEGSSILRYVLVESAMRIRNVDGSQKLYEFYDRLIRNKKKPMVARVALARKILVTIWYMIKNHTEYCDSQFTPAQRRDDLAQVA